MVTKPAHILIVDDEPEICTLLREILEDEGYEIEIAGDGEQARQALRHRLPDLLLLDIWLPDTDGVVLLKEWRQGERLPCPVVVMSGHGTVETAVEATRLGAFDFLEKPLSTAKLLVTVDRALASERLFQENLDLKQANQHPDTPCGSSRIMQQLRDQVRRIAQHDTSVLITGEPGTGKETFARFLHRSSPRREAPFIEVGVTAIARENSVVELFGQEEIGKIHYGRLEQAHGGVLFLEEVAEMDSETQARLLGALESRSFLRLGGKESVEFDVRIIASTRSDLANEVLEGRFRDDLYYHLNVVPLPLPPLRDHAEDIPELVEYYMELFGRQEQLALRDITTGAIDRLEQYHWPGNIRELKNLLQRLLILGNSDIAISDEEIDLALGVNAKQLVTPDQIAPFDLPLREAREEFERRYLAHQLQQHAGSVGRMAKHVGMERTHLYRKLRALGIDPKKTGEEN